jgi:hypothetical protein
MAVQSQHSLCVLAEQEMGVCSVGGVVALMSCFLPSYLGVSIPVQMISPFVDPVSKAKVEFVTTSEYEPSKAGKDTNSSWGSWFSSSKAGSKPARSAGSDSSDADVDIVVEDQAVKGPGTFGPFLHFYKTPFEYSRHQQLLSSVGLA